MKQATKRLEYLRGELRAERISYGEISELQDLVPYIDPSDVELLEAAGVPENADDTPATTGVQDERFCALCGELVNAADTYCVSCAMGQNNISDEQWDAMPESEQNKLLRPPAPTTGVHTATDDEGPLAEQFYVDIPPREFDSDVAEWVNIDSFETQAEAIKFAQDNFGADELGRVYLVSPKPQAVNSHDKLVAACEVGQEILHQTSEGDSCTDETPCVFCEALFVARAAEGGE